MQEQTVYLDPLEINELYLDFPLPPMFPFSLPLWPRDDLLPYFPLPPDVTPPREPTPVELVDLIQEETRPRITGNWLASVQAEIESEIDSRAALKPQSTPLEKRRAEAADELFLITYHEMQDKENLAKSLLGYSPLSRPNANNVERYNELHGSIELDTEAFKQKFRESYTAAWARSHLGLKSWLMFLKAWNISPENPFVSVGPEVTPDAIRVRVKERIAAEAAAQAEAARIAAEAAQAEAARIAAEAAQAEAARIAAEAAQAEAARIAAEAAQAEAARIAAEAAQAEAARIAAEAAQAEAARIAAEAAQAEAARIAAEAAQAEAARIAAEAMSVRIANTYAAPAAPVKAGIAVVTPSGLVVSTLTSAAMRVAVTAAISVVAAHPVVVVGTVLGAAVLIYTSRLGDGKAPERYTLQLPASDLLAQAPGNGLQPKAGTTVDLPYRIGSRSNAAGDSEIFVAKTDNINAPTAVRVIGAVYDQASGLYTATTADTPPRTLTWTPAVTPGDSSTTTPEVKPEPPIYSGATITPIDLRIDSFPELEDASFDDYIIVFPADSGLDPIYTMFKSRRDEPGVATGGSVASKGNWIDAAASAAGAPIPLSVAEKLRGREFRSFSAFRRAMWKAMEEDVGIMSRLEKKKSGHKIGTSPFTRKSERVGARKRYEIHHVNPIHSGGSVYDMDNLRILTPRQHIQIHKYQATKNEY